VTMKENRAIPAQSRRDEIIVTLSNFLPDNRGSKAYYQRKEVREK